jgi:hypothetical protein
MKLRRAIADTLRSKRVWEWEVGGAIFYGIPVVIRFITKSNYIPILSLPGFWISYYIPGNLVEKILVNAFFPGGAGGVAGETFLSNYKGETIRRKTKYLARLGGALVQTSAWSAFQYWGYFLWISGPHGSGNLFEHPFLFPINFLFASLSILTPDVVNFTKLKVKNAYQKLSKRLSSSG